jgi:hypothetical protein
MIPWIGPRIDTAVDPADESWASLKNVATSNARKLVASTRATYRRFLMLKGVLRSRASGPSGPTWMRRGPDREEAGTLRTRGSGCSVYAMSEEQPHAEPAPDSESLGLHIAA